MALTDFLRRVELGTGKVAAVHFCSPPELTNLLRRALGARADGITGRATLMARFWPRRHSRVPIGARSGMRERLSENSPLRQPDTEEP